MNDTDESEIRACPRCEYQPTEEELVESGGYCPECRYNPTGPTPWYDAACPRCRTGLGLFATWEEADHAKEVFDGVPCAECGYDGGLAVVGTLEGSPV